MIVSPSREAELRAFVQTKRIMLIRSIVWIFAAALLGALIFFFVGRLH
jgi:hypothetical protein